MSSSAAHVMTSAELTRTGDDPVRARRQRTFAAFVVRASSADGRSGPTAPSITVLFEVCAPSRLCASKPNPTGMHVALGAAVSRIVDVTESAPA
jgi:hypothetical protein